MSTGRTDVTVLRTADLSGRRSVAFDLRPDAADAAAIAEAAGAEAVAGLRFAGQVAPLGARDLVLTGRLTGRAVQPCVVTLAPVETAVDAMVERRYVVGLPDPEPGETEMPADDTVEPMPEAIDLAAVMVEALALALPDYPRAPGAVLAQADFGPPGVAPLTDADLNPFAALAALRSRGEGGEG